MIKKVIADRRSIRKYTDEGVDEEQLMDILECARLAPSGNNTQPWHFIVVKDLETRQGLADLCQQPWQAKAPISIVCVGDMRCRVPEGDIYVDENSDSWDLKRVIRDMSIAIEHMVLRAEEFGLGTCWIGHYTQKDIREYFGIPNDKFVPAVILLGHKAQDPKQRPRKPIEDILHYEKW